MHRWITLGLTAVLLMGCAAVSTTATAKDAPEYLSPEPMKALNLPFSDAVRIGDLLFLSGKLGTKPGTAELAPGGIQGETRQTMENIKRSVEAWGSRMDHVVKCTVFLADMAEWGAMNAVYKTYFPNPPARSAVAVSGLALDARVEIE
ncbi:MAG: Rid family hydrolase, partial [Pseudomonadota bacterium]